MPDRQVPPPRDLPISEWDRAHTLSVLREAKAGRGVGDINLGSHVGRIPEEAER